ncbi:Protein of unknown function [Gryllus bimaculatus]|nr:Protein of unknown function [Gryllus bimaculatus]
MKQMIQREESRKCMAMCLENDLKKWTEETRTYPCDKSLNPALAEPATATTSRANAITTETVKFDEQQLQQLQQGDEHQTTSGNNNLITTFSLRVVLAPEQTKQK